MKLEYYDLPNEKLAYIVESRLQSPLWVFKALHGFDVTDIVPERVPKYMLNLLRIYTENPDIYHKQVQEDDDVQELMNKKIAYYNTRVSIPSKLTDEQLEAKATKDDFNLFTELRKRRKIDITLAQVVKMRLDEKKGV